VGKNDGYAFKNSDICIFVDSPDKKLITPISESFQVVIWHLLVSHPDLQINNTKW
jgi:D-sedoheptulose 7-phosphate isomerase